MASGGSSAHRPPRAARYNTATAFPVSHPVNPVNASHTIQSAGVSGSISRSASRARAPLHSIPAAALAGPAGPAMARALGIEDDDEAEIEDRGQALIRRRQKERKQLRRAKEKGREKRLGNGEDATPDTSAPPSGLPDDTFGTQQARGAMGRSVSRARTPSANRQQPSDGYFHPYARSEAGYETPREEGLSPMDELRPASVYSSTADEEEVAPQDGASLLDDVVAEVIVEQTAAGSGESDEEEEDAEESGEGDEAVTLKDRQDVSEDVLRWLTSGNKHRTPLRFAHLETSAVPQIAVDHSKCRVCTTFHSVRGGRVASPSGQYPVAVPLRLVARDRVLLCSDARVWCRRSWWWQRRLWEDAARPGVVHRLALREVCRG